MDDATTFPVVEDNPWVGPEGDDSTGKGWQNYPEPTPEDFKRMLGEAGRDGVQFYMGGESSS